MKRCLIVCTFRDTWTPENYPKTTEILYVENISSLQISSIDDDVLFVLNPTVKFFKNSVEKFIETHADVVYSDYLEDSNAVHLLDEIGDITERFKIGHVILVRNRILKAVPEFTRYQYAWLYYLRLRAQELSAEFTHIDHPLYTVSRINATHTRYTFSDSFDYLFYQKSAELEYESVFKNMLKRRGALLGGDYERVDDNDEHSVTVSVVIPVLNREKFIGEAIRSVQSQTFADFEVLAVDAGSKDKTPDIVRTIQRYDKRVKLLRKPPGNIAEAINVGIKNARGKYIAQLDSDDFYEPNTLEEMVSVMESNPDVGLAISYYRIVDPDGNPVPLSPITHLEFDRNNILRVDGAGALRFFRRKVFDKVGLFDEEHFGDYGEDYDMVLRISERFRVKRVHKVLYNYRRHPGSTDATRNWRDKYVQKTTIRRLALGRRRMLNEVRLLSRGLTN